MKKIISILVCAMLAFSLVGCADSEKEEAISKFKENVSTIEANNDSVQKALDSLNKVIDSGDEPLDESTLSTAKQAAQDAKAKIVEVPEQPSKKEDIISKNTELEKELDISDTLTQLDDAQKNLSDSIAQMKQVTNPSEGFVVERLKTVPSVTEVLVATADNDPNGQLLYKDGGYSAVYFSSDQVDAEANFLEGDSIAKGIDGGGCVEVYETVDNANKRNNYLALFDGIDLIGGPHKVVGTVVIRTSNKLTATQQTDLETNIYNALTSLN